MKIRILKNVTDKETKETFTATTPPTVIERSKERGQEFIDAGVGEEIKAQNPVEITKEAIESITVPQPKAPVKAKTTKKKASKKSK